MKAVKIFLAAVSIMGILFIMDGTQAYASVAAVSFGAKYYLRFPCTCTAGKVWYIVVPPTASKVAAGPVAYVVGSQTRSKYNLPFSTQVLGLYNPELTETCVMGFTPYCWIMPTRGTILPMVGSSI